MRETGSQHQTTQVAMNKPPMPSAVMMLLLACGPELAQDDDLPDSPRKLEYEDSRVRLYRADRHVDAIYEYDREDGPQQPCGFLTDRAYDDLEDALVRLDPNVDYGDHPADCTPDGSLVHVDGFEHSPFECRLGCCANGLTWAALVYHMITVNLDGTIPSIGIPNGPSEPYVAIEPDQPCP